MESTQFDALARAWAGRSRRGLLRGLGGVGLGALLGWDRDDEAGAKDRKTGSRDKSRLVGEGRKKGKGKKKKKETGTGGGTPPPTRCVPTLSCAGIECGAFPDDGCGRVLNCGTCGAGKVCVDSTCECLADCCQDSDCPSGRCNEATNQCCGSAATICLNAGAQCGSVADPICGGTVSCGNCAGNEICNAQNECEEPCPSGEIRCYGVCRPGVCCEDSDCPTNSVCKGDGTCCQPEHKSVTCFPTQGAPYCGFVNNNCGVGVDCGGCPASNEICAPGNRCELCPSNTTKVGNQCCPNSNVCTSDGQQVCCSFTTDFCGYGSDICRENGTGCCTRSGGRCSGNAGCCSGSCQATGSVDMCGTVRYCA